MFKRANKVTALLVAAASIMSVVPAMASTRLGTKDGTIEKAYAFKDGKYIYQGYKTDDDNKSVYYNAGDKDKELADLTDANLMSKYDTNKAIANDGDEYLVDLSTGKVSDEVLASDDESTASDKLKAKLKKTDRYGSATTNTLTQVAANQFGEVWYQYQATTPGGAHYGYTDKAGTYVDADKIANLRVFVTSSTDTHGKIVKIDKFDEDFSDGVKATVVGTPTTIAQDKDYFYRVVSVNFTTQAGVVVRDSKAATVITTQKYLQKISKAQGEKEKDAYLPKTVESYDLTNTIGSESDITKAYDMIADAVSGTNAYGSVEARVLDGVIYVTELDSSTKVHTWKLKLVKNLKLDTGSTFAGKVDAYAVKKDGDKDQDIEAASSVSVDVNGAVWAIHEGKILKSEKAGDFKEIYTIDRSIDSLDVYDDSSLVAWENGSNVYTTVQEGKAVTAVDAPAATPAKTGWDQLADGSWNFLDTTGAKVANNWVNVGGVWYFLKADGVMATGWLNQNGTWYFLKPSGAMVTGWYNDNGTWYYLNASGAMLANTTVDGYVLGASGAWVK